MPIYLLTPINLDDDLWKYSTHKGICRIHAADEETARKYASEQFRGTSRRPQSSNLPDPNMFFVLPWTQENHVQVRKLRPGDDFDPDQNYREGQIEIPDENASFGSFDDVPNIDDLADVDALQPYRIINPGKESDNTGFGEGGYGTGSYGGQKKDSIEEGESATYVRSTPQVGPDSGFGSSFPQDIVTLVQQNCVSLRVQSRSLIQVIDEFLYCNQVSNVVPPQFWLPASDDENANLTNILSELRDELKRLNNLLESSQSLEEEKLHPVVEAFGEAGKKYLNAAATTAGTGTGMLLAVTLGHYMAEFGLVPWEHISELVGKIK